MDELVRSQQLIDDMAMAIAQGNDEQAREHYEEYKVIYEKITKKTPGEVKVDGKRWTAIADETINTNETVEILEINSTKLKVKRMEE